MKRIVLYFKSFHFILLAITVLLSLAIYFFAGKVPYLNSYINESLLLVLGLYTAYYIYCLIVWSLKKRYILRSKKLEGSDFTLVQNYLNKVENFILISSKELGFKRSIRSLPLHFVTGVNGAGKTAFISGNSQDKNKLCTLNIDLDGSTTSWHITENGIFFEWQLDQTNINNLSKLTDVFRIIIKRRSKLGWLADFILVMRADDLALIDEKHLYEINRNFTELVKVAAEGSNRIYPAILVLSRLDVVHGFQVYFGKATNSQQQEAVLGALVKSSQWYQVKPTELMQQIHLQIKNLYSSVANHNVPIDQSMVQKLAWNSFPFQMQQLSEHLNNFLVFIANEFKILNHPGFSGVFFTASNKSDQAEYFNSLGAGFIKRVTQLYWRKEEVRKEDGRLHNESSLFLKGVHEFISNGFGTAVPSRDIANKNRQKSILALLLLLTTTITSLAISHSDWREKKQLLAGFHKSMEQLNSEKNRLSQQPLETMLLFDDVTKRLTSIREQKSFLSIVGINLSLLNSNTNNYFSNNLSRLMQDILNPILERSLAEALQKNGNEWTFLDEQQKSQQRDNYYNLLETYLMVTKYPERMLPNNAASVSARIWYIDQMQHEPTRLDNPVIEAAKQALTFFYAEVFNSEQFGNWQSIDYQNKLISQARANLAIDATADAIYQLLVSKNKSHFEPIQLSDVIPVSYPYILRNDYKISSMYSRKIWENYLSTEVSNLVKQVSFDDWVLDEQYYIADTQENGFKSNNSATLEAHVRELYFEDYRKHWEAYIASFYMPSYQTLDEVHHNLRLLGGELSPLKPLSIYLKEQIGAYQPSSGLNKITDSILKNSRAPSRFSALQAFVDFYHPDNTEGLEYYLDGINKLAAEVESMLTAARVSNEVMEYASALLSDKGQSQQLQALNLSINRIKLRHEPRAGELLQHFLLLPVKSTWQTMLYTTRDALQAKWELDVYEQYMSYLHGRFPFEKNREDATLSAFYQFFGLEQGTLWRFYNDISSPFVTLHRSSIEKNTWLGMGLEFNDAYLNALRSGQQIARAMFSKANGEVGFNYAILPEPVPGASESRFSLDDLALIYRNEPQQWSDSSWLAGRQNSIARVQLRPLGQPLYLSHQSEGSWSLLRLLYDAKASRISSTEYELVWPVHDGNGKRLEARYRFRSDQAYLFLNQKLFTSYHLPRQIF